MNNLPALVIGASGGIGRELVKQLVASKQYSKVMAISRALPENPIEAVDYRRLDSTDEVQVAQFCEQQNQPFALVICCIGVLHDEGEPALAPEKRLEDIRPEALMAYFKTNTVTPAIWLKHGVRLLKSKVTSSFVFLTARVGSIADNKLGGWYGYRASKSALNMLIKSAQIEYARRAPNVTLVSYHPGTVDTALSKPFQNNVPKGKLFTAEFTASQLLNLLPSLQINDAPHYIDWNGVHIPW